MNVRYGYSLSLAFLFSAAALSSAPNRPASKPVPEGLQARALANYGRLPLSFEANRGQADPQVKFLSQGSGYTLLLSPGAVELNLAPRQDHSTAFRMSFAGAQLSSPITGEDRQATLSSYFIGKDPAKWITAAPNYDRVRYRQLYPGVDLVFYGNQRQLEYDLVVAPGIDPEVIRMKFDGADSLRLDSAGNLVISVGTGELRQHRPLIYQERDGVRQPINGRYVIRAHNQVAFEISPYDIHQPLIIDPVLTFATYLGTPGEDLFGLSATAASATYPAVAVDSQGNVYVTGYSGGLASQFPGPPGPPLTGVGGTGGGADVFVVKMNPAGTAALYSAVFGGGQIDIGGGIAVDSSGNAYVTGNTNSTAFPVTAGAPQNTLHDTTNAFVAKLNSTGTALLYSTFLGGGGNDWGRAIAVDQSGNAYVTGTAQALVGASFSFPLVSPISSTPSSGFLTKVNSAGTAFVYSTFLSAGIGYGIALDGSADAYVTGSTGTVTAPSPARAYVLKVNAAGSSISYGPVLLGASGGGLQSIGFGIALDSQKNAYVTGMTNDPNFPVTSGAAQTTYGGGLTDAFAVKLSPSGSLPPIYATFLGGIGSNILPERGSGIGVDASGYAYVSGTTQCIGFPVTSSVAGALNNIPAVLMKGSLSGSTSTWSPTSLLGNFDRITALAFDPTGDLYAGATSLGVSSGGGIYKSSDSGASWTPATSGITSTSIDAIAVDPNNSADVYAIAGTRIYLSTTGGTSWTAVGPTVGLAGSLAIGKTSPATIYAGSSTGLVYSTNTGATWTPATIPTPVNSLVADPNNNQIAYAATGAGVYKTVNAGVTWTPAGTGPTVPADVVTSVSLNSASTVLYAVRPSGLFYSLDGGTSWTQAILGFIPSTPLLVTVDAGNNVYVAFAGSGIGVGINGGTSQGDWSILTYNGLTQNQILALATPPGVSGTPYAGIVAVTDAFLTRISPDGSSFSSSTCIGGADNNLGQSVAVTADGTVYVSGATIAANFPTTAGALQPALAGLYDAFVAGVAFGDQIISPAPGSTLSGSYADFSWNSLSGATDYQLTVGTTPGGSNIFSGTTTGTSQAVSFIPCTGGTVYVQLSAEVSGSFQPATNYSYPCKSAKGDFDGNHFQDLIWQSNSNGQVTVNYYAGASPTFLGGWNWLNTSNNTAWKLVGTGDFNHDGVPDLVWENLSTRQVTVNYYGGTNGATLTGWAYLNTTGLPGWSVVAVADFDGNGTPDLVWQNDTTKQITVNYYSGTGGTTLSGWAYLNPVGLPGWSVVAAADFNGDGVPDLVWQNLSTRQVTVNYYGGTGGTTLLAWNYLNSGGIPGWTVVGARDLNADGFPDLIWQNDTTRQVTVNFYGGSGGAVLEGWNWVNNAGAPGWTVSGVADFDGNGEPDIVWQNGSTGQVSINYYNLGGAVLTNWNWLNMATDTTWRVVGSGDFDGNGVPDLVLQNISTRQVTVNYYGGSGGATLTNWAYLNSTGVPGWTVVAVADVNGDGIPDLIWQNDATRQVTVNYYGGTGGATLVSWAYLNSSGIPGWKVVAAADFDGNGVPDLVWQNTATRQVTVNYYGGSGGATLLGWNWLNSSGVPGWTIIGANDFDGNGVPDLVWQGDATSQVTVNYYAGPGGAIFQGWNWLNSSGIPGWRAIVPKSR